MRRMPTILWLRTAALAGVLAVSVPLVAADSGSWTPVADWPALPDGWTTGEVAGVGVDSHNHVFVFHRGKEKSVLCIEGATGKIVSSFGDGLFINAHGLEVDGDDNVWITDTRRHQVMKFSHEGELLLSIGEKGVAGVDASHFNQPTDVVVSASGEFYVSDGYGNNRVVKFSADGTFLREWGEKGAGPGQFDLPHGLALDDSGRVYVADRANQRVQVFDGDGSFLDEWGTDRLGEGSRPWGLEYSSDGRLYVIDGGNMNPGTPDYARISILDLAGKLVDSWSSYGTEPGRLSWGHDVAVGADGAVYTAEVRNSRRAQKFVAK